jgi:tetratricopeptide (TPR) repeat protein
MTLQGIALDKLHPARPGLDEEVQRRCSAAKELEAAGKYEAAREVLGDRWQEVGVRPNLKDLGPAAQAELLLRSGTLAGWIGSNQQIAGAQEFAKDLISESARIYEGLGLAEKVADAQVDLAVCYWRSGALDEARITLNEVLNRTTQTSEPRLRALANLALLERVAGRYQEALEIQITAAPLFEASNNHALRANFHNVFAQVLKELGLAEHREDYIDRALVELTAASYHVEKAGNAPFQASVENNLGLLLSSIGRYSEAHEHLHHARSIFVKLGDKGRIARVDDSRAKALIAEGRCDEAVKVSANAVRLLKEGDERSALAEALTTQATAFARLNRAAEALGSFRNAMSIAEEAGDLPGKGLAALTLVEELSSSIAPNMLRQHYFEAESLLPGSQNPGIESRLGATARHILSAEIEGRDDVGVQSSRDTTQLPATEFDEQLPVPCSLEEEVRRYEGLLIKRALENAGGSVTRAARLLGTTHQGLAFILNGRQQSLLSARKPVRPRRKSIIRYH